MEVNNHIRITEKGIEASLEVYIFANDGCEIAYSPALDIFGYGKTVKEAKDSFSIVIKDFFESCIRRKTLDEYLLSKHWTRKKEESLFVSPQVIAMAKSNDKFRNILSAPQFTKRTIPYKHSLSYC
ncbi:MAG: hypothetical protein IKX26_08790 [Bacteroidales bacterium]|nr:hypothetical protein [Bacteroidales bacterium]